MSDYKPGDIVNGHVLTSEMEWVPVRATAEPVKKWRAEAGWNTEGLTAVILVFIFVVVAVLVAAS